MNKYYTVDQIAELLTLHPKTVQRYIREGKIIAQKVGKRWCVSENNLNKFTGNSVDPSDASTQSHSKVSTVADITVQNFEEASKLEKTLIAILNSRKGADGNSATNLQYLEYENIVRITLWGNLAFVRNVLDAVFEIMEQQIYRKDDMYEN